MDHLKSPIVFIDDDCIFCNFWGNYIIKNDKSNKILISIPTSNLFEKAKENYNNFPDPKETIILYYQGAYYTKSSAVMKISFLMNSWQSVLIAGFIIPKKIRDLVYYYVAKKRKTIMKDQCHISELRDRERFIL